MFVQSAATIQGNSRPTGVRSIGGDAFLCADCPELVGFGVNFAQDEEIYGDQEEAGFVYKIARGAVRTYKLLGDGRRQIGAFYLTGDIFGFESSSTHRLSAEAISDATLLVFRRCALESLAMRNIRVARALWALTARSLDHAEDHMLLLGRKTAAERVAAFLLEMDERTQSTGAISLPMTRRDIADYLGLTLETVSRILSHLNAEGTVELSTARQITVQRRSKLRALASKQAFHSR
jgi:CRP/FNR family transcriptional regulator, nitrogen fixation regulation protein